MADVTVGQPYTIATRFLDPYGKPYASVTFLDTNLTLTDPTGVAASVLNAPWVSLGDGYWGLALGAAAYPLTGFYTWLLPSGVQFPDGTVRVGVTGQFEVGYNPPDYQSVQQTLLDVGMLLRDSVDGGAATQTVYDRHNVLIDASLVDTSASASADQWVGSEVFVLDPEGMAATNPLTVVAFDPASGTLTLNQNWNTSSSVPAGTRYSLQNLNGQGFPHRLRLAALRMALSRRPTLEEDHYDAPTVDGQIEYAVPGDFQSVYGCQVIDTSNPVTVVNWELPKLWRLRRDAHTLLLPYPLAAGYTLRILGRTPVGMPPALTNLLSVPSFLIIEEMLEILTRTDDDKFSQSQAAGWYQDRLRRERDLPYPNEEFFW